MENEIQKPKKRTLPSTDSLRIKRSTKKNIVELVKRLNKEKDVGRSMQPYQVLDLALTLLKPEHLEQLKEVSLTNADRLEQNYRVYIRQHGALSKDEYLGIILKQNQMDLLSFNSSQQLNEKDDQAKEGAR